MSDQPIPVTSATMMVNAYMSYMTNLGVNMNAQTQSVGYNFQELMAWLLKVQPLSDELRIFMGVYPPGHPNAGRSTCILWPYLKGEPAHEPFEGDGLPGDDTEVEPFNDGTLNP